MIGVFDSGFGGLTILKEFLRALPQYDYLYLGDTARAPYGQRSPEVIYDWTKESVDYLFKQECELVILACFTASAVALRRLQQEWLLSLRAPTAVGAKQSHSLKMDGIAAVSSLPRNDIKNSLPQRRILGVLIPLAEEAVKISRFGRVGILGTRATIQSGALEKELLKRRSDLKIFSQSAPLLVPFIEEGWIHRPETRKILHYYLRPLKEKRIDTLLLACTHYPLLYKEIAGMMGRQVKVVNPAEIVAKSLADYLPRHPEIESQLGKTGQRRFLTTDQMEDFQRLGSRFLGQPFKAERIDLNVDKFLEYN